MEVLLPHISGIITVIQEGRFLLSADDGRTIPFTLSSSARLEPQDLPALLAGPRVEVTYARSSGRGALAADEIRTMGP